MCLKKTHHRFEKIQRLSDKKDYQSIFSGANKTTTQEFIVLHQANSLGNARIGFAISKKMIAKAYQRNRIKRIVREHFRNKELPPIDVVILARKNLSEVKNKTLQSNLSKIWEKLNAFYAS